MHDIWAALIFCAICAVAVVLAEICRALKDIFWEIVERKDDY